MNDKFKLQIGVKAIIYDPEQQTFLALKRCSDQELERSESYDVPGGRIENNEDLFDALKRESREEVGLSLDTYSECDLLTAATIVSRPHLQIVRITYGVPGFIDIGEVKTSEEHDAAALLPLETDDSFHPLLNEALRVLKSRLGRLDKEVLE